MVKAVKADSAYGRYRYRGVSEYRPVDPYCLKPEPLTDAEIDTILEDLSYFETPDEILAQRAHERLPYHRLVRVCCESINGDKPEPPFSVAAYDLSNGGIGLLLKGQSLPTQMRVVLTLTDESHRPWDIQGVIMSCEPCGDGVYRTGVKFDQLIDAHSIVDAKKLTG